MRSIATMHQEHFERYKKCVMESDVCSVQTSALVRVGHKLAEDIGLLDSSYEIRFFEDSAIIHYRDRDFGFESIVLKIGKKTSEQILSYMLNNPAAAIFEIKVRRYWNEQEASKNYLMQENPCDADA